MFSLRPFRSRSDLRESIFWLAAAAAFVILVWASFENRFGVNDLYEVASVDRIVYTFERVLFHLEFGTERQRNHVRKWAGPVDLVLAGERTAEYRTIVLSHLRALAPLTALDLRLEVAANSPQYFYVHFVPEAEIYATASRYVRDRKLLDEMATTGSCIGVYDVSEDGRITGGFVVIPTDASRNYVVSCALEEITQSLGLPNDSELIQPSIFSEKDLYLQTLSINDRILIRALYDDRITPGMPKDEALKVAREIIAELVARVREEGEAALVHPRYAAKEN